MLPTRGFLMGMPLLPSDMVRALVAGDPALQLVGECSSVKLQAVAAVAEFADAESRLLTSDGLQASSSETLAVLLYLAKAKRIDALPDCSSHVATAHHENTSRKRTGDTS
jgi:hypothetical protein